MSLIKYSSNNPSLSAKDVNIIGKIIDKKFNGVVTAAQLLDEARSRKSPLHKYFEWDDSVAAEAWRLKQASKLIISIYVESDDRAPIRNYLNVKVKEGRTYMNVERVSESLDLINQVIEAAKLELIRWKERYGRYVDFFNLEFHTKGEKHVIQKEKRRGRAKGINTRGKRQDRKPYYRGSESVTGQ